MIITPQHPHTKLNKRITQIHDRVTRRGRTYAQSPAMSSPPSSPFPPRGCGRIPSSSRTCSPPSRLDGTVMLPKSVCLPSAILRSSGGCGAVRTKRIRSPEEAARRSREGKVEGGRPRRVLRDGGERCRGRGGGRCRKRRERGKRRSEGEDIVFGDLEK